jgi:hypothetical protein
LRASDSSNGKEIAGRKKFTGRAPGAADRGPGVQRGGGAGAGSPGSSLSFPPAAFAS